MQGNKWLLKGELVEYAPRFRLHAVKTAKRRKGLLLCTFKTWKEREDLAVINRASVCMGES